MPPPERWCHWPSVVGLPLVPSRTWFPHEWDFASFGLLFTGRLPAPGRVPGTRWSLDKGLVGWVNKTQTLLDSNTHMCCLPCHQLLGLEVSFCERKHYKQWLLSSLIQVQGFSCLYKAHSAGTSPRYSVTISTLGGGAGEGVLAEVGEGWHSEVFAWWLTKLGAIF